MYCLVYDDNGTQQRKVINTAECKEKNKSHDDLDETYGVAKTCFDLSSSGLM